jgi:hypothetical protein
VNEFVEECRREWRRLGVSDPIANEMAADLIADIEEAESEGGTAEDVVGNSAFDPRRFAGSWAIARGVTAPPATSPPTRRWPVLAVGLAGCAALLAVAAAVLVGGRQSSAVVSSVSRNLGGPRSVRVFPGSPMVLQHFQHFPGVVIVALVLLVVGVVGVGLALLYLAPWNGTRIGPWEIRRHGPRSGVPRT